jgi:hypothetical protein
VGEWNGEWSDASANWQSILRSDESIASRSEGLERTNVDDGTFWMDLTHFVMGFSLVDICFAYQGADGRMNPLKVDRRVWSAPTWANAWSTSIS